MGADNTNMFTTLCIEMVSHVHALWNIILWKTQYQVSKKIRLNLAFLLAFCGDEKRICLFNASHGAKSVYLSKYNPYLASHVNFKENSRVRTSALAVINIINFDSIVFLHIATVFYIKQYLP